MCVIGSYDPCILNEFLFVIKTNCIYLKGINVVRYLSPDYNRLSLHTTAGVGVLSIRTGIPVYLNNTLGCGNYLCIIRHYIELFFQFFYYNYIKIFLYINV